MSHSRSEIASAMLSSASTRAAVDFLFPLADDPSGAEVLPSDSIARRFVKGSLAHAQLVCAGSTTDPSVLAEYVRDPRVSVREALLVNPNTPVDTIRALAKWAFTRDTDSVLACVIRRLDTETVVPLAEAHAAELQQHRHSLHRSYAALARKADGSIDATRRLLSLNVAPLVTAIFSRIANGRNTAMSMTDAARVEALGSGLISQALSSVWQHTPTLTVELAHLAVEFDVRVFPYAMDNFTFVEPGSLSVLAQGSREMFLAAVVLGLEEKEILSRLGTVSASPDESVQRQLPHELSAITDHASRHRAFTPSFVNQFIEHLIDAAEFDASTTSNVSYALFRACRHTVPSALMLRWLRSQDIRLMTAWLGSSDASAPQPGQLLELFKQPGRAFRTVEYRRTDRGRVPVAVQHHKDYVIRRLCGVASRKTAASCPDLAVVLDSFLGPNLASRHVAEIATPVIESAFGDQVLAWDTLLTLATDWSGSLSDLIQAAIDLSGCEDRRALREPVVESVVYQSAQELLPV